MNKKLVMLYLIICALNLFAQDSLQVKTVDSVVIQKYMGRWYEISKIPNFFQDHCKKNVTATYTINDEGDIIVLNECINFDDEIDDSEGIARVADKKTNSKLEVCFVSLFGWNIIWGDYWIIELDDDYKFVAIATPSRKYGWILSRTKTMKEEDLKKCYQAFERNGFDISEFELTIQE